MITITEACAFTDWTNQQTGWSYSTIRKLWLNTNDYKIEITTEQLFEEFLKTIK